MLLAVAVCAASVEAQAPSTPNHVRGRLLGVFDSGTGKPLAGVQVRDALSGTYAMTSETGTVSLGYLTFRGDAAIVQLRKLGYDPKQILVMQGDTTPITEELEPVTTLAPVITNERYNVNRDAGKWEGFQRRCEAAKISCFGPDDLAKDPSASIADLLVHAKGVTLGACGGGKTRSGQCGKVAMHSAVIPPAYCQPTFYIDGFEWSPTAGAATDLVPGEPPQAPYTPANVKAIEVYPSTGARPLRFTGDPTCGAVVIWTK